MHSTECDMIALLEENDALKLTIDALNNLIVTNDQQYQLNLSKLQNELAQQRKDYEDNVEMMRRQCDREIGEMKTRCDSLLEVISSHEQQTTVLESQRVQSQQQCAKYQTTIDSDKIEVDRLRAELESLIIQISTHNDDVANHRAQRDNNLLVEHAKFGDLEHSLAQLRSEKAILEQDFNLMKTNCSRLDHQLELKIGEIQEMKTSYDQLWVVNGDVTTALRLSREQLCENAKPATTLNTQLLRDNQALKDELEAMKAQSQLDRDQFAAVNTQLNNACTQIITLNAKIALYETHLTQLAQEKCNLQAQLDIVSTQPSSQDSAVKIAELETTVGTQRKTIQSLQDRLVQMAHTKGIEDQQFKDKIDSLQSQLDTIDERYQHQLHALQEQHEADVIMYKTNQTKILTQISSLVSSKTQLQQHFDELNVELTGYKQQYSEMVLTEMGYLDRIQELLDVVQAKDDEVDTVTKNHNILREKIVQFEAWYNNKDNLTVLTKELEQNLATSNIELTEKKLLADEMNTDLLAARDNIRILSQTLKEQNDKVKMLQNLLFEAGSNSNDYDSVLVLTPGKNGQGNPKNPMTNHNPYKSSTNGNPNAIYTTPSIHHIVEPSPSKTQPFRHVKNDKNNAVMQQTPVPDRLLLSATVARNMNKGVYLKPMIPTFETPKTTTPPPPPISDEAPPTEVPQKVTKKSWWW